MQAMAVAEGWPGDGTPGNPYVIENYTVDAGHIGTAILIGNTTVSFVIRNCDITGTRYVSSGLWSEAGGGVLLYDNVDATVERNNITDCYCGVLLDHQYNAAVQRNNISSSYQGVMTTYASGNIIMENVFEGGPPQMTNVYFAIEFDYRSSNNLLYSNRMENCGIFFFDTLEGWTSQNIPTNNTVNGRPVYYYANLDADNSFVPLDAGQVLLGGVSNLKILGLNLSWGSIGIQAAYSSGLTISENECSNGIWGMKIENSDDLKIENNNCSKNAIDGIDLEYVGDTILANNSCSENVYAGLTLLAARYPSTPILCNNNSFQGSYQGANVQVTENVVFDGNDFSNCLYEGLFMYQCSGTDVVANDLLNNNVGILMLGCLDTLITLNNVNSSAGNGIRLEGCSGTEIYSNLLWHNNGAGDFYSDSHTQAYDDSANKWHSNENAGNLWWEWRSPDDNSDGIVDSPYVISGGLNWDPYPLSDFVGPPRDLSAVADDMGITLSWNEPAYSMYPPLVGYRLFRSIGSGGYSLKEMLSSSVTSYLDADVTLGETYGYYLIASYQQIDSDPTPGISLKFDDTTPPVVQITSPSNGAKFAASQVQVTWTCSDDWTGISRNEIRLDSQSSIDVGTQIQYTFSSIPDGTHTAKVTSFDASGNHGVDTVSFTVDTSPPAFSFAYPTFGAILNTTEIAVQWTGQDSTSGIQYYELKLDSGSWLNKATSTSHTFTGLTEGSHECYLRAYDKVGNQATISTNFTIDSIPPSVTIVSPLNGTVTNSSSYEILWTGEDSGLGLLRYEVRIDGGSWVDVGLSKSYVLQDLIDGSHIFEIAAIDNASNLVVAAVHFVIDTVPPAIDSMQAELENLPDSATVSWIASDSGSGISNFEIRIRISADPQSDFSGDWTDVGLNTSYAFNSLDEMFYGVQVRAHDKAGNIGVAKSIAFYVDTTPPSVIEVQPIGSNVSVSEPIKVKFSEGMEEASVTVDVSGTSGTIEWNESSDLVTFTPSALWEYALTYTVTVSGEDSHGNPLPEYQWSFTTTDFGRISGRVLDSDGNAISGVIVKLETGENATTDQNGVFSMAAHAGAHSLIIEKDGYEILTETISFEPGENLEIEDLILHEISGGTLPVYIIAPVVIIIVAIGVGAYFLRRRKV